MKPLGFPVSVSEPVLFPLPPPLFHSISHFTSGMILIVPPSQQLCQVYETGMTVFLGLYTQVFIDFYLTCFLIFYKTCEIFNYKLTALHADTWGKCGNTILILTEAISSGP